MISAMRVVRQRITSLFFAYRRAMPSEERSVEPVRTQRLAEQLAGKWAAMHNGEVIEAGDTFDEVMMRLHARSITSATVMRIPAETEAELVGLG